MKSLDELKQIVKEGLELIKKEPGIIEGLVYASANERTVGRLVHTTHIPSNGLEEPKSDEDLGVTVEIWFEKNGKKLLGFGNESSDLSINAVKKALQKAKRDAVEDKDFVGFLKKKDLPKNRKPINAYHDKQLMDLSKEDEAEILAKISWETIEGAADVIADYAAKKKTTPKDLKFILNGDNFIIRERMALATTGGIYDWDETTLLLSFLTAMIEQYNAKGSSWGVKLKLDDDFSAYDNGRRAALAAINGIGGKRIKSGKYKVVFGHQATTELFSSLYLPHANLAMVDFGATIFRGKYGQQVASPLLTLYDDATLPGGAGTKRITCEGCPTGKTMIINKGKLVGYLSNYRTYSKSLNKREHMSQMLGVDPHEIRHAIFPQNGFRYGEGGGRNAAAGIGISATNLVIDSEKSLSEDKLIKKVKDGIFIGRLWYTYPVGGYSSGIISGTAVADCYLIKDGKLTEPILPNTIRLEDNISRMMLDIIGIGNNKQQTVQWLSDEISHAPWVAIDNVNLIAINQNK